MTAETQQYVGSKESDWWSEIHCCHDNFKTCHVKSTAVMELTVHFQLNFVF